MPRVSYLWPLLLLFVAACAGSSQVQAPAATGAVPSPGYALLTDEKAIDDARTRLTTLAADAMEGREATTEGERKASAYLADQLKAMGVQPGGDLVDGERTYFQRFHVRTARLDTSGTWLAVYSDAMEAPRLGRDWLTIPTYSPALRRDTLDVVFLGYGISAPDQGHDDFADVDLRGKMAVVLGGKPAGIDSLKLPMGTLDPSNFQIKWLYAMQRGAAAVLFVDEHLFRDNWEAFSVSALNTSMQLPETPEQIPPAPFLATSDAFGQRLLEALGAPAGTIEAARAGEAVAPFASALQMGLSLQVERGEAEARNVVGYLPGTGNAGEFVAMGAHYDHHGRVMGAVYNGADDDGSGTVVVLNVAEALARDAQQGHPPARSLLFVFHTAEEKGLFGSEYFTAHPEASVVGDIHNVVAQINIDMVGREHPDSLYVVGAYRLSTTFGARVDSLNQQLGPDGEPLFRFNRSYDAPDDPENIYERSDHFNYAKRGVPIVFFTDGMGANWKKNSPSDDYHRPSDDVDKIDFGKMMRTAQLVYAIARETAEAPQRPEVDKDEGPDASSK